MSVVSNFFAFQKGKILYVLHIQNDHLSIYILLCIIDVDMHHTS